MSHDSGFRRGGQDFTRRQNPATQYRGKSSRRFEQRLEQRFHDHEKEAQTPHNEDTAPEE